MACECYGRLPCLGGVLERGGGGRRAEGWTSQVHCLLASANSILGQLYQGIETGATDTVYLYSVVLLPEDYRICLALLV